jgi:UPF0271 protein
MPRIDINCDMGESTSLHAYHIDQDLAILPWLSSINLACGFHAGDPYTMHQLTDAALSAGIAVGAHPSFHDRENFGRSDQQLSPVQVYDIIIYQLGALNAFLRVNGTRLHHVKPHGALYNMAARDVLLADAVCRAIKDFDERLVVYGLSGSELIHSALSLGLSAASEVFADRSYQDDGTLTPRSRAGALIEDDATAIAQVLQMVQQGDVTSVDGRRVPVKADTVCVHSDGKLALAFARQIFETLQKHGIEVASA